MEYQVPQFIEVEDKIFGPLTLKQFIYIGGGIGLCAIAYFYLPFILALLVAIPVAGLAGALAFYRINNKPFEDILEAGFGYYFGGGQLYLWRKVPKSEKELAAATPPVVEPPKMRSHSRAESFMTSRHLSTSVIRTKPMHSYGNNL